MRKPERLDKRQVFFKASVTIIVRDDLVSFQDKQ